MKKLSESDHDDTKQSIKDIFRECGAMWKSMSESEKKHYMELHELKKKEWDVAYQTFMDGLPDKDDYLRQLKALRGERRKYLKTYREKRANKLTKPPRKLSAFNIYMRDQLGGVTKEEIQERFKEAGHGWKALSEDVKAEYKREAQQINDHEMEEFMLKKAA
jgi:arsenate reductase-like glutaredoxin family protein